MYSRSRRQSTSYIYNVFINYWPHISWPARKRKSAREGSEGVVGGAGQHVTREATVSSGVGDRCGIYYRTITDPEYTCHAK